MKKVTVGKVEFMANNQTIVYLTNGKIIFNSYGVNIAEIENGETRLDECYWDFSRTTSKYRCQFLREYKEQTRRKIKSGVYKLCNLNEA